MYKAPNPMYYETTTYPQCVENVDKLGSPVGLGRLDTVVIFFLLFFVLLLLLFLLLNHLDYF